MVVGRLSGGDNLIFFLYQFNTYWISYLFFLSCVWNVSGSLGRSGAQNAENIDTGI
jgi:hypothetical protein